MIRYDHPIKVYYKDIDQMGIVYYSRYFEFFEEARTEMLSSIGLDYSNVEDVAIPPATPKVEPVVAETVSSPTPTPEITADDDSDETLSYFSKLAEEDE